MARTVAEINTALTTELTAQFAAAGITINPATWSKRNILRAICYAVAVVVAVFEQLQDAYLAELSAVQAKTPAATAPWLQDRMFRFQYSATNPQTIQLNTTTMAYEYPVEDDNLKIVTACAVRTTVANQVLIKVAKDSPLAALGVSELAAAQDYVNTIGTAGITYIVQSDDADRISIAADIYYNAAYSAIIQATVIAAIDAYLEALSVSDFNGSIQLSNIERLIRGIEGVNDVVLQDVKVRYNSQSYGAGIDMVSSGDWLVRKYNTGAGYIIQEDTTSYTFADTLNFVAE